MYDAGKENLPFLYHIEPGVPIIFEMTPEKKTHIKRYGSK
jgi:hypothetical protein